MLKLWLRGGLTRILLTLDSKCKVPSSLPTNHQICGRRPSIENSGSRIWAVSGADHGGIPSSTRTAMELLHHASFGIGVLGVLVIVFGVCCGLIRFVLAEVSAARGLIVDEERKRLRHVLGYYLLLGLEFLIAADIIDTLMKPNTQDLVILGAIVAIRTVISYSLNSELVHEAPHKPTLT